VIEVDSAKNFVRIVDLHVKSVCVNVTAISSCGRESNPSNCCTTNILCKCEVYPCVSSSDCKGVSLKWGKVHCAKEFKVYYDNVLKVSLPHDAEGVRGLPALNTTHPEKIFVSVVSECGESDKVEANAGGCPCTGDSCGRCHRCKQVKESCSCDSSSSSSSDSHSRRHHRRHSRDE
jgi:hypothetical protein